MENSSVVPEMIKGTPIVPHIKVENGHRTKDGRILKEIRIPSYNAFVDGHEGHSILGIKIDVVSMTISVWHLLGQLPEVNRLFWALLADDDIRTLIKRYQLSGRLIPYLVWRNEKMSGRKEWFITSCEVRGPFSVTKTKKLLDVSCFGKLTQEKDANMEVSMYIGDFVELCVHMGLTEDVSIASLRERSGVEYLEPRLAKDANAFTLKVTHLL